MSKYFLSPIALVTATAFLAGTLHAQTTFDTESQQDFNDGLLESYSEDFGDFTPADNDFDNESIVFDDGGAALFSFTATTASFDGTQSPAVVEDNGDFLTSAPWFVQGDGYDGTALSVLDNEVRLRFTDFTGGVDSFGGQFFLTEASETAGEDDLVAGTLDIIVTFSDSSTITETLASPSSGGELEFFGVIAEQGLAITQVDVISNNPAFLPTAGFVTVGAAIPEPATVVFWSGLGVFALVVALRRRKRVA